MSEAATTSHPLRAASVPGLTEFVFNNLIVPRQDAPPISLTPGGHLCINVNSDMYVRVDDVLLREEALKVEALASRGPGGHEAMTGISKVSGRGTMVLSRGSGVFQPLRLRDDTCFFVASAVWAFDRGLLWEGGVLPGSRGSSETRTGQVRAAAVSLLRLKGNGLLALRSSGACVAIKVAADSPTRVRAQGLLGWVGRMIPVLEPGGSYVRCEGEGALLLDLPGQRAVKRGETPG